MEYSERLYGKIRFDLLKQLVSDKTMVSLKLLGQKFERLTMFTGTKNIGGDPYVLVDCPNGFRDIFAKIDKARVHIEFKGKDKVPYTFRTSVGKIDGDDIWLDFPGSIERMQRRKHFRLKAPLGMKTTLFINMKQYWSDVINISFGGILLSMENQRLNSPQIQVGDPVRNINVMFRIGDKELPVNIKKSEIRRITKNPETKKFQYALQFLDMLKEEENKLKDYIYQLQREILQKRSIFPLDE